MNDFPPSRKHFSGLLKCIEVLLILVIGMILMVLIFTPVQWAGSGTLRIPVRVFVFDAVQLSPISRARVAIFRGPPANNKEELAGLREGFLKEGIEKLPHEIWSFSDKSGQASVIYDFSTESSSQNPVSHAHLNFVWVWVEAEGYGDFVSLVREESHPTADLRKAGLIEVSVGLSPGVDKSKTQEPQPRR